MCEMGLLLVVLTIDNGEELWYSHYFLLFCFSNKIRYHNKLFKWVELFIILNRTTLENV